MRSHRSECGLGGDSFGIAFGVVKGSSFRELGGVSEEGQTGQRMVFSSRFSLLFFSCRWHLATHKMKVAGEFPYAAGLPATLTFITQQVCLPPSLSPRDTAFFGSELSANVNKPI